MSVRFHPEELQTFQCGALSDCIESIRTFLDNDGTTDDYFAGAMSTAEIGKLCTCDTISESTCDMLHRCESRRTCSI